MKRKPIENGEIKIERGVSMPGVTSYRKPVYPVHKMQVGDSFFVSKDRYKSHAGGTASSIRYSALRQDVSVAIRIFPDGLRVWRVK